MARIIASEKPLIMQKRRQLELHPEVWIHMDPVQREEMSKAYVIKEMIPLEIIPSYEEGENPWDSSSLVWEWWEVTV